MSLIDYLKFNLYLITFITKTEPMKNLIFNAFLICMALFVFSCETPAPEVDMEAVKAEIQALEDAFAAAAKAKDPEAQAAYFADDATSLPPGEPPVVGKAAILERMKNNMAQDTTDSGSLSLELVDVFAEGDLAVEVGKWTYTETDGDVNTGKYISVFEKRDGKYVCIRDIWNSDSKGDDDEDEDEVEEAAEEASDDMGS